MMRDVLQSLRTIRAELREEEPPERDADLGDHVRFIFHHGLGVMLSPWYWVVMALVVAVVALVDLA